MADGICLEGKTLLTDAALKALRPKEKSYKVTDRDGMYVVVSPAGTLSFRLDYRLQRHAHVGRLRPDRQHDELHDRGRHSDERDGNGAGPLPARAQQRRHDGDTQAHGREPRGRPREPRGAGLRQRRLGGDRPERDDPTGRHTLRHRRVRGRAAADEHHDHIDDDVLRLGRTRPFDLLPREAVQLIAFSCEKQRLRAGEALFFAGEAADSGYFVQSGAITLLKDGREPKAERRVSAGALISETALYAPTARRVSARAAEDAVVMRIPRETFRRVLAEFPAGAEKIRAALAVRTRRLVDGLEATRIKSFEGSITPRPRAAQ